MQCSFILNGAYSPLNIAHPSKFFTKKYTQYSIGVHLGRTWASLETPHSIYFFVKNL